MVERRYPKVGLGDLVASRVRKKAPLPPTNIQQGSWGGGMAPMGPQRQRMPIPGEVSGGNDRVAAIQALMRRMRKRT